VTWLRRLLLSKLAKTADKPFSGFETRAPSHQNAVDLVPGWNHAFPETYDIRAGAATLYNDGRILWAIEQFGDLAGKRILELGPLEASHTSMLDRHNPAIIDAVEANRAAFTRCLVAKEVLDLHHVRFHLGDFVRWLEREDLRYDLIVASGVLYHMRDPIQLIELISRRTDAVYLWTHYFDSAAVPPGDPRAVPFVGVDQIVHCGGAPICLHGRRYFGAERAAIFCGGPEDLHYWMEKDAIIHVLHTFGFDDVRLAHDEPGHPNGPSISIFARRSS
jgi:hypothetical protein